MASETEMGLIGGYTAGWLRSRRGGIAIMNMVANWLSTLQMNCYQQA